MRPALLAFFFLTACSSDKFTNPEAGVDAAGDAAGDAGCPHELCDDFDQPNEIPGNIPPWSGTSGTLTFAPGNKSKQSLEAKAITFGSYLRWNVKSGAKGVTCSADVWVEPIADAGVDSRDRAVAVIEVDAKVDAAPGTFYFTLGMNDVKGVSGSILGPSTLMTWGGSTTVVPTQKWVPLKFEAMIQQNGMLAVAATFDTAVLTGNLPFPHPITAFRINLGAAGGMATFVRWDNVTCDSR